MAREQDWLASAGFVVLHTDYRGHAAGDPATLERSPARLHPRQHQRRPRTREGRRPRQDRDVGRSMGGGVTLNALVAAPGLVDAAVIYAA